MMETERIPTYTLNLELLKLSGNLTKEAIQKREYIEAELKTRKEERENILLNKFKRVSLKNKPIYILELEIDRVISKTKKEIIKKELELRKKECSDFFNDL